MLVINMKQVQKHTYAHKNTQKEKRSGTGSFPKLNSPSYYYILEYSVLKFYSFLSHTFIYHFFEQ